MHANIPAASVLALRLQSKPLVMCYIQGAAWMFLLVVCEYLITDVMLGKKKYAFNDAITSMNIGLLFLLIKSGGRFLAASFYPMVYNRLRLIDLPDNSAFTWLLCLFTQDFVYYLGHRAIHGKLSLWERCCTAFSAIWIFWSFHQIHHSSEYYNFTTAARMGAIQDVAMTFFDLLQAVAIPPNVFIVHRYLVILFQFWLHASSETIFYFIFIIAQKLCPEGAYSFTRLFGTYAAERMDEEIAFGLVTPVKSFDLMWCEFFEFKAMGYDKGQMRNEENEEIFPGSWNKMKAALWPPAYLPGMKTKRFFLWLSLQDHTDGVPEVESPIVRYNPPLAVPIRCYLLAQWLFLLICFLQFVIIRSFLDWTEFLCRLAFPVMYIQMFGYYFDHKRFSLIFDSTRLMFTVLLGFFLDDSSMITYGFASLAVVSLLDSAGKKCVSCSQKGEVCSLSSY
ncbi:fatty acid hydroxylase family protein [Cooperia oncophora]